jgi:hypothetical protein
MYNCIIKALYSLFQDLIVLSVKVKAIMMINKQIISEPPWHLQSHNTHFGSEMAQVSIMSFKHRL